MEIGRGVKQGCYMSPILFNLCEEYLLKEALAKVGDLKIVDRLLIIINDRLLLQKHKENLEHVNR